MKIVASLLASFVLFQAECFALVGGPNYSGGTYQGYLAGIYAGTLYPEDISDDFDPAVAIAASSSNTLGIFSLGVPQTGATRGSVFIFQNGSSYQGSLAGVADTGRGTITGILNAVRLVGVASDGGDTITYYYDGTASGGFGIEVYSPNSLYGTVSATRLKGQSTVAIKEWAVISTTGTTDTYGWVDSGTETYFIDGLQQAAYYDETETDFAELLGFML